MRNWFVFALLTTAAWSGIAAMPCGPLPRTTTIKVRLAARNGYGKASKQDWIDATRHAFAYLESVCDIDFKEVAAPSASTKSAGEKITLWTSTKCYPYAARVDWTRSPAWTWIAGQKQDSTGKCQPYNVPASVIWRLQVHELTHYLLRSGGHSNDKSSIMHAWAPGNSWDVGDAYRKALVKKFGTSKKPEWSNPYRSEPQPPVQPPEQPPGVIPNCQCSHEVEVEVTAKEVTVYPSEWRRAKRDFENKSEPKPVRYKIQKQESVKVQNDVK